MNQWRKRTPKRWRGSIGGERIQARERGRGADQSCPPGRLGRCRPPRPRASLDRARHQSSPAPAGHDGEPDRRDDAPRDSGRVTRPGRREPARAPRLLHGAGAGDTLAVGFARVEPSSAPMSTSAVASGFALARGDLPRPAAAAGSSRSPKMRHSAGQVATQAGSSPRATSGAQRLHFSTIFFAGSTGARRRDSIETQLPQPMQTFARPPSRRRSSGRRRWRRWDSRRCRGAPRTACRGPGRR